jgi:hypothetical protein
MQMFTKTFFRFCMGFIALLALSFAFIVVSASQQEKAPQGAVSKA